AEAIPPALFYLFYERPRANTPESTGFYKAPSKAVAGAAHTM
ncbi:MAG: hypothetical protein AVDCRST_MAG86-3239, partial [uncultured Truepera sp.]